MDFTQDSLPEVWRDLSEIDKQGFLTLQRDIQSDQEQSRPERRMAFLTTAIQKVLRYIDWSPTGREIRAIACGVCVAGRVLCINTRQLSKLIGKCKSSVNSHLQQMEYRSIRTKIKTRQCLEAVLPVLGQQPEVMKQWTVRVVGHNAAFCFVSSFPSDKLPPLTNEDLESPEPTQEPHPAVVTEERPKPFQLPIPRVGGRPAGEFGHSPRHLEARFTPDRRQFAAPLKRDFHKSRSYMSPLPGPTLISLSVGETKLKDAFRYEYARAMETQYNSLQMFEIE